MKVGTTLRNAIAATIESTAGPAALLQIWSGTRPATPQSAPSGLLLVQAALPSSWLGSPSTGVVSKDGTWSATAIAGAGDTPTFFRITDAAETETHLEGTAGIGVNVPPYELVLDGTITAGQPVPINTAAFTAPEGS
jgi:hypothetical protein